MKRKFPGELSTRPMLGEDGQRRNHCVFEWLNIEATDSEAPAQRTLFPIPMRIIAVIPANVCGGLVRFASQTQERIVAALKSLANARICRQVSFPQQIDFGEQTDMSLGARRVIGCWKLVVASGVFE